MLVWSCALALVWALGAIPEARALTPEQATYVGGDLTTMGKKLAALKDSSAKVLAAVPAAWPDLKTALHAIADSPADRPLATQLQLMALSVLLLVAAVAVYRLLTANLRAACIADALRSRGATGLLALDLVDRGVVAGTAYVLSQLWFQSGSIHDLLGIALLWSVVRWWFAMWLAETLLRPGIPQFRLVHMETAAALNIKIVAAVVLYVGIASISLLPILLRSGMPLPSAQVVALMQGLVVAAGGVIALLIYHRHHLSRRQARVLPAPLLLQRLAFGLAAILVVALWLSWTIGVMALEFSIYHSLVWSLRIAAFALIVDSILRLSAETHAESEAARMWIPFAQRSIRVAAILAIGILFAELWLVQELALVKPEDWEPIRRSLITTALALISGYAAWRYFNHWTEHRLAAAMKAAGPAEDDPDIAPASRLTTVLPMLRVLFGVSIALMTVMIALSQLGVNIGPLIAGASVVGLAISFGSQALVRDIVSGIFFMSDDAFRLGEYIDTGKLKGNVERISVRSVQLRHQNGQVHTIPYGQLTSITNYSRDWQTVKFNVRLSRDADIEKVRKTVKQIGLEMMQDPELGKELLMPLKLQGVAEITDNALVVRLKFTVRPNKPSWVQREALKRIYRVFGEKSIEFPSSTVMVRTVPHQGSPGAESQDEAALAGAAAAAGRLAG
jgi:small-conductance mechanosensitive channel